HRRAGGEELRSRSRRQTGARGARRLADHRVARERHRQPAHPAEALQRGIYGVVVYNARRDAPVVVGFQDKGPLLIGTLDNTLGAELELVSSILARGCPTEIVDRMQDAVHTKIVINLTNALDALVGQGWRPLSD